MLFALSIFCIRERFATRILYVDTVQRAMYPKNAVLISRRIFRGSVGDDRLLRTFVLLAFDWSAMCARTFVRSPRLTINLTAFLLSLMGLTGRPYILLLLHPVAAATADHASS